MCKRTCKRKTTTILSNSRRTKEFLESLPRIYLIGVWACCGVREHYYAGCTTKEGIPYVWDYDDHNGTCDNWYLRPIDYTTTGTILAWTTNKKSAERLAKCYNSSASIASVLMREHLI